MVFKKKYKLIFYAAFFIAASADMLSADNVKPPYWLQIGSEHDDLESIIYVVDQKEMPVEKLNVCKNEKGKFVIVDAGFKQKLSAIETQKLHFEQAGTYGDSDLQTVRINPFHCYSATALNAKESWREPEPVKMPVSYEEEPISEKVEPVPAARIVPPRKITVKGKERSTETAENKVVTIHDEIEIMPEVKSVVTLSNRFHNYVQCPDGLELLEITSSKEIPVETKRIGSLGKIKFLIGQDKTSGKKFYVTDPADFFVVCGDNDYIYKLIAYPKDVSSKTIRLKGIGSKAEKNIAMFKGLAHEQKIVKIMKQAAQQASTGRGGFPSSYTIKTKYEEIVLHNNEIGTLMLSSQRTIRIDGEGLELREFITVVDDRTAEKIKEKHFLDKTITEHPFAVMLIKQENRIIAYILEKKDSEA